jgi:hypothetical protein
MEGEETAGNDMGRQLCKAATTQDGDQTTTADEPNKGPRYVPTNMLLRCRGDVLAAAGCRNQQRSRSATVPAEPPSGELLSQLSGCLTRTGLSFSPKWQLFDHEPLPRPH